MNANQEGSNQQQIMTIWIIWGALLMSLVLYGVIGLVVTVEQPSDTSARDLLKWIFVGLAVVTSGVVFFLRQLLQKQKTRNLQTYQVRMILSLALAESIAIYGLVYRMMGGEPWYLFVMIGWSALLMLFFMPSQRDREQYLPRHEL